MGDPAGVGPEVLLKSYKKAKETQNLVAISDFSKIQYLAERHGVRLKKLIMLMRQTVLKTILTFFT